MIRNMRAASTLLPVLKKSVNIGKLPQLYQLSHLEVIRKHSTENPGTEEVTVREKIHLSKPTVVKWKRPPFAKNFFVGKFDTELLAFPEILNNEQLTELENTVISLNNLYKEKVNSLKIDENKEIPKDLLQELKDLGLFGRMIPGKYGGMDLTNTACLRLNEVLGLDWSIAATLTAHEFFATQAIVFAGTEEQKTKYLPNLASGSHIAALCCAESKSGSDLLQMETSAMHNLDENYFTITGSKSWVTNAQSADYFVVFAKTASEVDGDDEISCFIVDKSLDGVVVEPYEKTSLHGVGTAMVRFNEVNVHSSNMLGCLGAGFEIFYKVLDSFRFMLSTCTFGALKGLLDSVTGYVINTERWKQSLGDIQLVRVRLSKISTIIYAMESVSYFTAALLDSTENPDIALESSIVKVFNSEGTLYCVRELMNALGSSSFIKEQHLERFYRDAQALAVFEGSNDVARLCIGLTGFKYLGFRKAEEIIKVRNAYFYPKESMVRTIRQFRILRGWVKYDQDLAGHMHPSLVEAGNHLEQSLQRFEVATETILGLHGSKIIETQLEPKKAADIAIDIYAMAAVLARSSRSYCTGLQHAEHEIRIALTFCSLAHKRVVSNLEALFAGPTHNNDGNILAIGNQVIGCNGYFPEHPLKQNF